MKRIYPTDNEMVGLRIIVSDEILKRKPRKYRDLAGKQGIIRSVWEDNIGIEIENERNNASSFGYFYLRSSEFCVLNQENNEINGVNEMSVENYNDYKGDYTVAKVRFLDGNSEITYRIYNDGFLYNVGDIVVVKPANHCVTVAKIVEIYDSETDMACSCDREIVCPVDMSKYTERKEKAKEIAKLKKQMDEKVKELQGIALYELMAQNSPELREMLDKFTQLTQM